MRNYEDRAKDFIKEVFPYIVDDMSYPFAVRKHIREYNARYTRNVKVSNGVARIALITSDYVVKFNYDEYEVDCVGGCEDEMATYEMAEREGFAYLFAKISRFSYCGRNFYIMPRINGIGRYDDKYANDFMTQEERDWCEEHDISDLHCNNYGFRKGRVCIIDYACTNKNSFSFTSESWSPFTNSSSSDKINYFTGANQ